MIVLEVLLGDPLIEKLFKLSEHGARNRKLQSVLVESLDVCGHSPQQAMSVAAPPSSLTTIRESESLQVD